MTLTTIVERNCNVRDRLKPAGEMVTLCHHSTHAEIMEATGELYRILNELDIRLDIEELLTRPVNEAIEYCMRTTVGADYPMLNQTERNY